MAVYDVRGLDVDFVVHYGGDESEIDAYTFANSLVALGGALQAINNEINPGYSLEISVVALGGGSFRPQIKTRAKRLASLFASDLRKSIVPVLAAILVQRCFAPDTPTQIEIRDSNVEITAGDDSIIMPRDVYDGAERVRGNAELDRSIRQTFEILEEDDAIKNFGIARSSDEREDLPVQIDRDRFARAARPSGLVAENTRTVDVENAELRIVRAVFEDSSRRWQFVWQGVRISAPILDQDFREAIVRREVSITAGDVFIADMRITQSAHAAGIWVNDAYEILRVKDRMDGPRQTDLLGP